MDISALQETFIPTREAALRRVAAFQPSMGREYTKSRNYDLGPDDRSNISLLSPYVRSRLLLEEEVVRAALASHSYQAAEKFIQEVFWRSYWKGWLELRPEIWDEYLRTLSGQKERIEREDSLAEAYHSALEAKTRFECFNFWVQELKTTGYLHNHARMWFASIWIFYLELPWQLGAEFFYRHLLDGDPASNTLSWRWVAGLQTKDKRYIASAQNIKKYTDGRFSGSEITAPREEALDTGPFSLPEITDYKAAKNTVSEDSPLVLLAFDEDLYLEHSPFSNSRVSKVIGLSPHLIQENQQLSELVLHFRNAALEDALSRAGSFLGAESRLVSNQGELRDLLQSFSANTPPTLAFLRPRVGFWRQFVSTLRAELAPESSRLIEVERDWDSYLYPHARSGFFKFRKQIPAAIKALGLAD